MSFHVGQKVVCVDDTPQPGRDGPMEIVKGHTYTVRWSGIHEDAEVGPVRCIRLQEIERQYRSDRIVDLPFMALRFRPVQTRSTETGMSILRRVAADAANRRNLVVTR